ncbi:MAG: LexA family transcriptional regulator [Christensenellaceae bacterium]|nr:LexA family transcriptional regulator [Christensenellaceae bacterium]
MSRLGDLIRTERLRAKLTPKQVARKCGVSESYIMAVEAGTRIIADDQARRILKTIGLRDQVEADFTLDDIAATVDLLQVQPAAKPQPPKAPKPALVRPDAEENEQKDEGVTGSVWLDALSSVLKRVPVMNAVMKPVDHRLVPIQNGRIEGANPDKVFYYMAPDDSMRGFRIHSGDVALMVPAQSPVDNAVMLVEFNAHRYLRKIKKLDSFSVLLQSYDREYDAQTVQLSECSFLGRAVKLEITL